ncbi:MAG: GTPase Era [Bacilli bacterium]
MAFKSGFVAIIGRPNVGKSTFMNYILGKKVSIISPKPQTTRNRISGVYTTEEEQIIFIDTPGIHKPKHELGQFMNKLSINTLQEVDVILMLVDSTEEFGGGDQYVCELLKKVNTKVILVFNKIDLIKNKEKLMENVIKFHEAYAFSDTYYISAKNGDNVNKLLTFITGNLEEGPMYYPKDQVTDHPEHFIIGEIIREKILFLTKEEVPHSIAVVLEEMKTDENNLLNIRAVIYVERSSQKKIIIGKNGSMIKEVGTLARKEIVGIMGQKVYLELWVKVEEDWRNKKNQLKKMGYFLEK